jgi:hypothetical protein
MNTNTTRDRWLTLFLWVSVLAWGIGLGGKLFELVVVISAWSANPPASLSLIPYGPRYPHNPGDFFQPLSAILVIATVGMLVSGWNKPRSYKLWLWVPLASLLVIWMATPTLFWPMIQGLYGASTGAHPLSEPAARSLVNKWLLYDWVRTALIAVGFVSSIRAISVSARSHEA